MRTVSTVAELRASLAPARRERRSIGLVPTMGAFHEGHISLMRRARADCELVVVSLFVNPAQFGEGEDLEGYPRDPERDAALAAETGVDLLFAPRFEEVYPPGFSTTIEVAGLGDVLCGAPEQRGPAHFRGVATVVTKLLNMCQPDVAYFGAKDFQQALVVKRLVRDLDLPVRIEVCRTVRDEDGLALSSRNGYLSSAERARALSLKRSLDAAERAITGGATSAQEVRDEAWRELRAGGVEPEYVEVLSAREMEPLEEIESKEVLIAVAARIGRARLIDSTVVDAPPIAAREPVAGAREHKP
jgi:pantoate--beta-alanine ligase